MSEEDLKNLSPVDSDTEKKSEDVEEGGEAEEVEEENEKDLFDPFVESEKEEKKDGDVGNKEDVEEEEIDEEDARIMDSRIKKGTAEYEAALEELKLDREVDRFLASDAGKEYEGSEEQVRALVKHPSTKGIKIEYVARMLKDPSEVKRMGAEEEREAIAKAEESNVGGSSVRSSSGSKELPDAFELSTEEFNKIASGVRA
jgi:hypothetical protein